jgi:hypothetical protein
MIAEYCDSAMTGFWPDRYVDRLERRDGRWAIALRRVVMGPNAEISGSASAGAIARCFRHGHVEQG